MKHLKTFKLFEESVNKPVKNFQQNQQFIYGMEPTENISHILNIIEKDFGDEINGTEYEGFPIYVDYYKKVEPKY
jgi:hypothetical protein